MYMINYRFKCCIHPLIASPKFTRRSLINLTNVHHNAVTDFSAARNYNETVLINYMIR